MTSPSPAFDPLPGAKGGVDLSSRRLAALIASLNSAVLVEDECRRVVLANQKFCETMSIPTIPEALVGEDCRMAAERSKSLFVDPEGFVRGVAAALGAREPVVAERLTMADGRVLERDYIPIWEGAEYLGHLWNYRDITGQVRASEEIDALRRFYERILDEMPAQLAVFDAEGVYRYVNPAAVRDPELRRAIIGKTDIEYSAVTGRDPCVAEQRRAMLERVAAAKTPIEFEETLTTRSGNRYFARFISPMLNALGSVEFMLGYGLDITDRRRAQEAMREAKRLAEDSAKAKEQFLANMSHEIRTPLNAVVGTAHLLQSTPLDALQQRYVDAIRYSADTLLAIINDILDLTKIGSGHLVFERVPFRVGDLIVSLGDSMRAIADRKGIQLRCDVDASVPRAVVGDPTRLNQVLLNLVSNAVKFTSAGSVAVEVEASAPADGRVMLEFRVSDTGVGIAPDKLTSIFDAFTQERSDTTRRFGGTGLGLAIVRELVSLQGGTIRVESVAGEGSTFIIQMPFESAPEDSLLLANDAEPGASTDLTGIRILLVEDNEMNQFVATQILTRSGATVEVERNGRLGVEHLRRDASFDVVLMDIQMPEMDGFEATRRIRTDLGISPSNLPILALTASALVEQRSKAVALGMNDFVMKPFDPRDLQRRIALAVRNASARAREGRAPAPTAASAIDVSTLDAHTMGDPEFTAQMIDVFLEHAPSQLARLREAVLQVEREEIALAAHKLRSAVGAIGARTFSDRLWQLEEEAPSSDEDVLLQRTAWCDGEMERVERELRLLRARIQRPEIGVVSENEAL